MEEVIKIAVGVILAVILLKERDILVTIISMAIIWLLFTGFIEYISRKPYEIFKQIEYYIDIFIVASDTTGYKPDKDIHLMLKIVKIIFDWLPIVAWIYFSTFIRDIVAVNLNKILDSNRT